MQTQRAQDATRAIWLLYLLLYLTLAHAHRTREGRMRTPADPCEAIVEGAAKRLAGVRYFRYVRPDGCGTRGIALGTL